jgi:hypothetical protein
MVVNQKIFPFGPMAFMYLCLLSKNSKWIRKGIFFFFKHFVHFVHFLIFYWCYHYIMCYITKICLFSSLKVELKGCYKSFCLFIKLGGWKFLFLFFMVESLNLFFRDWRFLFFFLEVKGLWFIFCEMFIAYIKKIA